MVLLYTYKWNLTFFLISTMKITLDEPNRKLMWGNGVQAELACLLLTALFVLACCLQHGRPSYVGHGLNLKIWWRINSKLRTLKIITFTSSPLPFYTWIKFWSYPLTLSARRLEFSYFAPSCKYWMSLVHKHLVTFLKQKPSIKRVLKDQAYVQCTINKTNVVWQKQ